MGIGGVRLSSFTQGIAASVVRRLTECGADVARISGARRQVSQREIPPRLERMGWDGGERLWCAEERGVPPAPRGGETIWRRTL